MNHICSPSFRETGVFIKPQSTDRIFPSNITLKLEITLKVFSHYLFIGSGKELLNRELLRRLGNKVSKYGKLNALEGGLMKCKEFYKENNIPTIPGSSLKGAVRSRIELGSLGINSKKPPATFVFEGKPLSSIPRKGTHGWRHVRIWCESIFEKRVRQEPGITPLEDLMGIARKEYSLASRVYFSPLYCKNNCGLERVILKIHHKKDTMKYMKKKDIKRKTITECLEAIKNKAVFLGELLIYNATLEDLGLLFYGLGLDKKYLCGKPALILLGANKYRCRELARNNRKVTFGIVEVNINFPEGNPDKAYAPWVSPSNRINKIDQLIKEALEKAFQQYGLRKCFNEIDRRFKVEPCP